jgi:type II secretory pathway pseudopilin PulG
MVSGRSGAGLCVGLSRPQRGVTYLALLLAAAITSAAMAAGMTLWSQTQRRERETQLLWAGGQIRQAIAAYARAASDFGNRYPRTLEELLLDPRSPAPRRHLRQIYDDPMTRSTDWGLVRDAQGRIVGVYSRAEGRPLKTGRFAAADRAFEQARSYADWRFTAVPDNGQLDPPPARPDGQEPVDASPAVIADPSDEPASIPASIPATAAPAVRPPASAPLPAAEPAQEPEPEAEPEPVQETDPADEPGTLIEEPPAVDDTEQDTD